MKNVKVDEVVIDGCTYVPKGSETKLAPETDGMKYCVIRTYSAGVHIGYVAEFGTKQPQYARLLNSRRLHYWENACSLSQVAMDGVCEDKSRIAMTLPEIELTDVIEVIPCSDKAMNFFKSAKEWKK